MTINRKIAVAPMMNRTDRHCRYFYRMLSQYTLLYTEMVTTGALIYGNRAQFLQFHPVEHPIAIQLGGADPQALATCAKMAEDAGYDEVNLNIGCPSDRVQAGRFGLMLMQDPALVSRCITAMKQAVAIPVTIKIRTGVDQQDSYACLKQFVQQQVAAGVDHICIHARKGWLQGLSPRENREIPPLQYERVHQIKQDFPMMEIGINGGVKSLDAVATHLNHVDAVMIGRAVYKDPFMLADVDRRFFGCQQASPTRFEVVEKMRDYIEMQLLQGVKSHHITRHMGGLFRGQPKANHLH